MEKIFFEISRKYLKVLPSNTAVSYRAVFVLNISLIYGRRNRINFAEAKSKGTAARNRAVLAVVFDLRGLSGRFIRANIGERVASPGRFSVGTGGKSRRRQWPRQRTQHAEQCVAHAQLACYVREIPCGRTSFHNAPSQ